MKNKKKLQNYPISFDEIIDCVLRSQDELNDAFCENINQYAWTHPKYDSTEWGCFYEREIRRRMNRLGKLNFLPGDHNTGEDLTCVENPDYSIEIKTSRTGQFWNANSSSRRYASTKYTNPNKKVFYILINHDVEEYGEFSIRTKVSKIYFGMLSKNDWTAPKGGGAAYLKAETRNNNCLLIWQKEKAI